VADAANPAYAPIPDEATIFGKVVAVLRVQV
jgi:SOS-response transcriptional repressor LexA